jgi:ribosomal protein S1
MTNQNTNTAIAEFSWDELENNNIVKTKSTLKSKVLCRAPYAQELYNLMQPYIQKYSYPKIDETWGGRVSKINKDNIIVNIDNKDQVVIMVNKSDIGNYIIDQEVEFIITDIQEEPFKIKGSIDEFLRQALCDTILDLYENKTPIKAKVLAQNNSGYTMQVSINGVEFDANTFMHNINAALNKMTDSASIVGEEFEVLIDYIDNKNGSKFTVSRKRFIELGVKEEIKNIKFNHVYSGSVTGTTEFGIFVEFNDCLTGMIHKANVHPDYVSIMQDVKPGTNIEFFVKEIIGTKLILTQIQSETVWDNLYKGQTFNAKVKDTKPFGVLVFLDDDTKGLIPLDMALSEYKKDEIVKVKVISFNKETRKIILKPF